MLVSYPYVYSIDFWYPGRKTADVFFASAMIKNDVREVDGRDAPVAARWRETFMDEVMYGDPLGGHGVEFTRRSLDVEIRHHDGQFYAPLSLLHDVSFYGAEIPSTALQNRPHSGTRGSTAQWRAYLLSRLHPGCHQSRHTVEFMEYSLTLDRLAGYSSEPLDLPQGNRHPVRTRSRQAEVAKAIDDALSGLLVVDGMMWGRCAQPRLVSRLSGPRKGDIFVMLPERHLSRFGAVDLPDEDRISSLNETAVVEGHHMARRVEDIVLSDAALFDFDETGEALARIASQALRIIEPGLGGGSVDAISAFMAVRDGLSEYRSGQGHSRLDRTLGRLIESVVDRDLGKALDHVRASLQTIASNSSGRCASSRMTR